MSDAGLLDRLTTLLDGMDPARRTTFYELAQAKLGLRWRPNPGRQMEAYASQADVLGYGGAAGGGKLQDVDELVLAPSGWRRIGDLKSGSRICAVDGGVTEIFGVFPQGIVANYRVWFHDGTSCLAGLNHNWLGWWTGKPTKIRNERSWGIGAATKWTTAEIISRMDAYAKNNREYRFAIPVTDPVTFNVPGCPRGGNDGGYYVSRQIDPYLLGLLIGDGSLSIEGHLAITSADEEIERYLFGTFEIDVRKDEKECNEASSYHFRGETRAWLVQQLSKGYLGLSGCKAESKFVPRIYLFGSVEERWALLQGLMDTDGWIDIDGDCYYGTVSRQLSEDVAHLARSLGAVVTTTNKRPNYTYLGEKKEGQPAFALRIKVRDTTKLFRLSRKLERCRPSEPQSMSRYVERIEYSHDAESVCIAVRHPTSLYITKDFIVTHNTDLLLGLALTAQRQSVIFRRAYVDLRAAEDRLITIVGGRQGYNGQDMTYRADGRMLEFGALEKPGSEYSWQGRPHDFIGLDEGAQLSVEKVQYILGWLRSVDPGVRKRVVIATNPPMGGEGEWLIEWFAPWVDPSFPNPANFGELRWCIMVNGRTQWVDGPGQTVIGDNTYTHESRTFIEALLDDNPYLADSGYRARLENLPEPLRSQLLRGDFMAGREDHDWQVIPTAWVRDAQERWRKMPERRRTMIALAMDVAMGGSDDTKIAALHDENWFAPLVTRRGVSMTDPSEHAALLVQTRRDEADISVDGTGGWGTGIASHLKHQHGIDAYAIVFSKKSNHKARDGKLAFRNLRAEMYWRFREALAPDSEEQIALPPGSRLLAQLTTPRYFVRGTAITIEDKADIRKRTGGSTDEADAVIMAWHRRTASVRKTQKGVPGLPPTEPYMPPPLVTPDRNDGWML